MTTHVYTAELTDSELLKLGEITTARQMVDTLGRMGRLMQTQTEALTGLSEKVGSMHTDIEVMKERDKTYDSLKEMVVALNTEIQMLKIRAAQQDGAFSLVKTLKDFGPWIMTILVALWAVLERAPK